MAEATNATTDRMPIAEKLPCAAVPMPIAVATPVMTSHSGLVCLLTATNAFAGRRIASTNANPSKPSAATASASKNQSRRTARIPRHGA
jgi:hypothetical protein